MEFANKKVRVFLRLLKELEVIGVISEINFGAFILILSFEEYKRHKTEEP